MSGAGKAGQAWRLLRTSGPRAIAQRAVRAAYGRLGAEQLDFPLLPGDIADSTRLDLPVPPARPTPGTPLRIAWVTTPPAAGSGGHTTMFRMVEALEEAGHTCELLLYDRYAGDLDRHRDVIRTAWPWVRAGVSDVGKPWGPIDAAVATSWQTAHVLARHSERVPCRRLYFAQDFEPYFYPRGSEYALAEDTYRFGFRTVAVGHMVARSVEEVSGEAADVAEFGCDTDVYRLTNDGPRDGVAFYAKPGTARRGFLLAALALDEVHHRHPEVEIHLFGDSSAEVPFPVTRHGNVRPSDLSVIYNRCVTGLAMSFTNISLIAEELLACGTVPVVNDHPDARADIDHPAVRWALPTPGALADELSSAIEAPDAAERARAAAAAVRSQRWSPARATVLAAVEREVYG